VPPAPTGTGVVPTSVDLATGNQPVDVAEERAMSHCSAVRFQIGYGRRAISRRRVYGDDGHIQPAAPVLDGE
jgi:hypothetical protein